MIRGHFYPGQTGSRPAPKMQALLEIAPVAAFFAAYYIASSIYVATAVLMAAMAILLVVDLARERRIPSMHALSAVLVFAFGTATLVLHNERFIQWKPTVFYWLAAIAFLGSFWVGKQTLAQRLLGAALTGNDVPQRAWRRANAAWVVFDLLLGALNLLVAFHASERTWVHFKVIGLTGLTFAFAAGQALWLTRQTTAAGGRSSEAST
jgi:intracellular septation protein